MIALASRHKPRRSALQVLGKTPLSVELGSKAKHLSEMLSLGLPVPPGFVVKNREIKETSQCIEECGGYPVAVRSSGGLEDMGDASFAGMYETYLNVQNEQELNTAIKKCFESASADRVQDYIKSKGLNFSAAAVESTMHVLVQKMVQSERSGVLFTIDPVEGKEEEFYIETCLGLGERLVSGAVTPSRFRWNWQKEELSFSQINDEGTKLSLSELKTLSETALTIQRHYGRPQDIEWAFDEVGKLWILQSRPITQINWRKDVPELTNADLKDGGISARVCPPMMFSLYQEAMQTSMSYYFKNVRLLSTAENVQWMFHYYGRAFWNVGVVKTALARLPGYDEKEFDVGLGIQKNYGESGAQRTTLNPLSLLNALLALCGVTWEYQDCLKMVKEFTKWFEETDVGLKKRCLRLSEVSDKEFWKLAHEVFDFHFRTETSYFRTIYNNSNYQSDLRSKLKKWDKKDNADLLAMLGGLDDMAHMKVQRGFEQLVVIAKNKGFESVAWLCGLNNFLKDHYHHGDVELDLTVPRWGECPDRVKQIVSEMMTTELSKERTQTTWIDAWKRFNGVMDSQWGWRLFGRDSFYKMLITSRRFLSHREQMRTYSTRAYFLWRMIILEGAKRLGLSDTDIHLLRSQEFLARKKLSEEELRIRRNLLEGYRFFNAPNEFGGELEEKKSIELSEGQWQGIGCSSGEIEGVVRVIQILSESNILENNEILVTQFTDPGWTPVMARASAVITEVGGVLSHAAVIGREYGIPAVLNLAGATKKLKSGQRVRVNGRTGVVTLLEEVP